jgi:glycosyltransferase involved in cell wall biosynthesis
MSRTAVCAQCRCRKLHPGNCRIGFYFSFPCLRPLSKVRILLQLHYLWFGVKNPILKWFGLEQSDNQGSLTNFSRKWGVHAEKIILLGLIQRSKLFAVLKRAEATVLPSRYDNLPKVLAFGKPIKWPHK